MDSKEIERIAREIYGSLCFFKHPDIPFTVLHLFTSREQMARLFPKGVNSDDQFIEERTGIIHELLVYPYGGFSERLIDEVVLYDIDGSVTMFYRKNRRVRLDMIRNGLAKMIEIENKSFQKGVKTGHFRSSQQYRRVIDKKMTRNARATKLLIDLSANSPTMSQEDKRVVTSALHVLNSR